MDKLLVIIKREYLTRVRSKGFIIGTILSPLLMTALIVVPMLVARAKGENHHHILILDQTASETLYARTSKSLLENEEARKEFELSREAVPVATNLDQRKQQLNKELDENRLDGYLVIPPDVLTGGKITYHTKKVTDFGTISQIKNALNSAIVELRMEREGINPSKVKDLSKGIDIETINVRGEQEKGQTFVLAYVLLMILYLTILIYGMMVMRGVIEEKHSRIIEVMLSSVRPFQLLLGKILGIGLVGLTQYFIWASFALILSALAAAQAMMFSSVKLPHISFSLMFFFIAYFICGYFLYATLYAIVGAVVSSEEDGQQMQMPVTMTLVLQMVFSSVVLFNPNSTLAIVLSLIPFFTPVLMFLRITVEQPPWWQITLSFVLLIATMLGCVWLAAKIYRVGVLMYGKRPNLPELMRWLKYS